MQETFFKLTKAGGERGLRQHTEGRTGTAQEESDWQEGKEKRKKLFLKRLSYKGVVLWLKSDLLWQVQFILPQLFLFEQIFHVIKMI